MLQRPGDAVDDDRRAGDHVFAAAEGEARRRFAVFGARFARRRFGDRFLDQPDRVAPFGFAQPRFQPQDDLGRVGVREEVGEPRLRRAPRLGEVEDDGRDEFFVGDAGHRGDPVFGRHLEQEFAELLGRDPLRHPFQLFVDLHDRLVEEGRRAGEEGDRPRFGELFAGPRQRLHPLRHLAREAALEVGQAQQILAEQQLRQALLDQDDDRFFAELGPHPLRRLISGVALADEGREPGVGVDLGRGDGRGDRDDAGDDEHRAGMAHRPRGDRPERAASRHSGAQSIDSGPLTSAWRN